MDKKNKEDKSEEIKSKADMFSKLADLLAKAEDAKTKADQAEQALAKLEKLASDYAREVKEAKTDAEKEKAEAKAAENLKKVREAKQTALQARDAAEICQKMADQAVAEAEGLATDSQKGWAVALLILTTVALTIYWFYLINRAERELQKVNEVSWILPATHTIKVVKGSTFSYDATNKKLLCLGPITDDMKADLAGILVPIGEPQPAEGTRPRATTEEKRAALTEKLVKEAGIDEGSQDRETKAQLQANDKKEKPENAEKELTTQPVQVEKDTQKVSAAQAGYWQALNALAFEANKPTDYAFWLLLLGGISGVLGVQLRSLVNFIGLACFKNSLSLVRWWPWYVIRPMVGFLLGVLAVVMIESNLVSTNVQEASGTRWWVGVALIAGFGASDFVDRLRLVSQTIFGKGRP